MKNKHIGVVLIALSLMAVTFVSTVAATTTYYVTMEVTRNKKENIFYLTIDTTSDGTAGPFDGTLVDPASIVVTYYDKKNEEWIIDPNSYTVVLEEDLITINFIVDNIKKDLPKKALASNVVGNVGTAGDTFFATGPGWGWGGHY